jgi:NAD(P)H dehydrogenase (quinone)
VIEVAKLRGVQRIVYTSFLDPDAASPFPFSAAHGATEAALRASGLGWTVLRVSGFAEALIEDLNPGFEAGVYQDASPRGRVSYVGRADVARAAVAALIDSSHDGKTYEITGPAALSSRDVAAILSCISGRRVEAKTTPVRDYVAQLKQRGMADYYAEAIGGLHVAIDEGRLQKVSNDVKKLTGQPANLVEEALRDALMERQRQAA